MKPAERHAVECDTRWESQEKENASVKADLREIFRRLNGVEVRLAGMAGAAAVVGSLVGSFIGKLF